MKRKLTNKGKVKMVLTRIAVSLKSVGNQTGSYKADFLVDAGATDSMVPAAKLRSIGVIPVGKRDYELADGTTRNYEFGLPEISFMNEITAGRVIFGPDNVEPILGVTALESVGITVDPRTRR
jgi:clan AA aspartic protease